MIGRELIYTIAMQLNSHGSFKAISFCKFRFGTGFRPGFHFGRVALGLAILVPFFLVTAHVHGNGWEHAAIPFDALVKALDFEVPEMRRRAARSLGFRGQPEAVGPLLQCLSKPEKNHQVRAALYLALGNLRDRRALPVLSACLNNESRDELRSVCVSALGSIGEKSALPQILAALENDPSILVQNSAVDALSNFSEQSAVKRLSALVAGGDNQIFRQRAIRALGRTGSASAVQPLLQALKTSSDDSERVLVVSALMGLRSKKAVMPLKTLLQKSTDPRLRTQIVIALGAIDDGSIYPTLIELLSDRAPAVRYFAVKGLHDQGLREAVLPISRLSMEISRHLDNHTTQELLSEPLPVLADLSFQLAALEAITDLGATQGIEALLMAARPRHIPRDSSTALKIAEGFYRQRRAALYGLGYTRSREAVRFLAGDNGVGDPDFRLRAVAARSIGVLGFSDALEVMIVCLDDPMAEVRWTAATVLGLLKDKAAVVPLLQHLSDKNSEVRRQAAFSLGFLGDPRAYDKLSRLVEEDENQNVQTAAAFSIQLLKKP